MINIEAKHVKVGDLLEVATGEVVKVTQIVKSIALAPLKRVNVLRFSWEKNGKSTTGEAFPESIVSIEKAL